MKRILWALPSLGVSLSNADRGGIVQLVNSADYGLREAAMRCAVCSCDEALGRGMIDLYQIPGNATQPQEENWFARLLAKFGGHLSFEDLAKRLRPSAIGFVIGERGYRREEIDWYGACLDREWRQIVAADDTEIEHLPEIVAGTQWDNRGGLPELHEPSGSQTIRLDRSDSWTSGPPTDPSALKKLFTADPDERIKDLIKDRRSRIDAILAAWQTEAFQWFGREFSVEVFDRLYQQSPAMVERWVEPALQDSITGQSVRRRLGTFVESICRVLLHRKPSLGRRLWSILDADTDSPVVFDRFDIAFSSGDNPETISARQSVLERCCDDISLARLARKCQRSKRQDWLDEAIGGLISANQLWRKMKGLTLASFSDITLARFQHLVSMAGIDGSWVEEGLDPLRENVRNNCLARHWYSVYLSSSESDEAWAAIEIVASCADERFLNWEAELNGQIGCTAIARRRRSFLDMRWSKRDMGRELSREDTRRDHLFGRKIPRGEIIPFV